MCTFAPSPTGATKNGNYMCVSFDTDFKIVTKETALTPNSSPGGNFSGGKVSCIFLSWDCIAVVSLTANVICKNWIFFFSR